MNKFLKFTLSSLTVFSINNAYCGGGNLSSDKMNPDDSNSNSYNTSSPSETLIDSAQAPLPLIFETKLNELKTATAELVSWPKLVDCTVADFIKSNRIVDNNQINQVLNTIYTNDDSRILPHYNQTKKPEDVMTLRDYRQPDKYLCNTTYDATGKTNKEIVIDVQKGVKSGGHYNMAFLSKYNWNSFVR